MFRPWDLMLFFARTVNEETESYTCALVSITNKKSEFVLAKKHTSQSLCMKGFNVFLGLNASSFSPLAVLKC